jgi:large subunit ribosomal protein L25
MDQKAFRKAISSGGMNALLDLIIHKDDGKETVIAMLKDMQRNPMSGEILHADFVHVRMDETIITKVQVHHHGEAVGVIEGGLLQQQLREIEVESLPGKIPETYVVDISAMGIGSHLTVADLPKIEGVRILDPLDTIIMSISAPKAVEEAPLVETADTDEPPLVKKDDEE